MNPHKNEPEREWELLIASGKRNWPQERKKRRRKKGGHGERCARLKVKQGAEKNGPVRITKEETFKTKRGIRS